jgi:hypothetical protein
MTTQGIIDKKLDHSSTSEVSEVEEQPVEKRPKIKMKDRKNVLSKQQVGSTLSSEHTEELTTQPSPLNPSQADETIEARHKSLSFLANSYKHPR